MIFWGQGGKESVHNIVILILFKNRGHFPGGKVAKNIPVLEDPT